MESGLNPFVNEWSGNPDSPGSGALHLVRASSLVILFQASSCLLHVFRLSSLVLFRTHSVDHPRGSCSATDVQEAAWETAFG